MGCCCPGRGCCADKTKEPVVAYTPYEKRGCRDIIFLLAFLAALAAAIAVLIISAGEGGNPNKIIDAFDYKRGKCEADTPYGAWPYPLEPTFKICVKDCAATETDTRIPTLYRMKTEDYMGYCLPTPEFIQSLLNSTSESVLSGMSSTMGDTFTRSMGDLATSWWVILCALPIALLLSFLYVKLQGNSCFGKFFLVIAVLMFTAFGVGGGYALYANAEEVETDLVADSSKLMKVFAYTTWALTFLVLLVILCLWSRILIALEVVKEASRMLDDVKLLVFFPIIPTLLGAVYILFWIYGSLFIFSVTDDVQVDWPEALKLDTTLDVEPTYTDAEWRAGMEGYFAYHFFHLLWMVQFLIYFNYFVIAGVVARWYFARRDANGNKLRGDEEGKLPNNVIWASTKMTCRYHIGTIAFGSLLIAIIQFIRACVKYIEEKTKVQEPNPVQRCMFASIQCCLKCAECCLDKISKNAFCWASIWGDSFITSACSSFKLLWENLGRVAAINIVGEYLLVLGKLMVAAGSTGICSLVIVYSLEVSNVLMPACVIFVLSWLVAQLFMAQFDTTIDAIFMCFLVDAKFHEVDAMFAPKSLIALVDKHKTASKKIAIKMNSPTPENEKEAQIEDSAREE